MKDTIIRSDKAPFDEIEPLSGWELRPLNEQSGQPVRHFASISELIAYAYTESPARKALISQLAGNYHMVILDAAALGDLTLQVVNATLDLLTEEGVLEPETRERIGIEMDTILSTPSIDLIDAEFPNCTGDSATCPDCGPGGAQDIGYDPMWPTPLNGQPFETEAPSDRRGWFGRS